MQSNRIKRVLKISLFAIVGCAVFGFLVMSLWNSLMPALFGLHVITFWQALGLFLLAKIFFGGFRGHGGGMHWRRRMFDRWEQMSPEERERFRQGMRGRCGPFGRPADSSAVGQKA